MKSKVLTLVALLMVLLPNTLKASRSFAMYIRTPKNCMGNTHRTPAAPIRATQDGHNISFATSCVGETIEVFDGDTLLYITIIREDGSVDIPENITGEVELRLIIGERTYSAEIEL